MPVLYITQLLGLCLGIPPERTRVEPADGKTVGIFEALLEKQLNR